MCVPRGLQIWNCSENFYKNTPYCTHENIFSIQGHPAEILSGISLYTMQWDTYSVCRFIIG